MKYSILQRGIAAIAVFSALAFIGCPKEAEADPPPPPPYTVSYDGGEGSGTPPADKQVVSGTSIPLPSQGTLTAPAGKTFDGWKTGGKAYSTGDEYKVEANVTFTAQWKAATGGDPVVPDNPLVGSWASPSGDNPSDVVIFTKNRVYFSKTVIKTPRQGNLDTGASTIKLKGTGGDDTTYDYELSGDTITVKKVLNNTTDVTLKRRDGSENTGLEDTWISISLSSTNPASLLIIIEAPDKGNSILYNFDYDKWWKTDTYTYDATNKELRWDNWSITPTKYSIQEDGKLKIGFPKLTSYDGSDIVFTKTTYF